MKNELKLIKIRRESAKPPQNCKCLDLMRENWKRESANSDEPIVGVYFDHANIQRLDGRGMMKTAQRITLTKVLTKKNGDKYQKSFNTFVTHMYCPFCGKKFREPRKLKSD